MGFSDDDDDDGTAGASKDPFDIALAEYHASAPPGRAPGRGGRVAVESEPIEDYEGPRFLRGGGRSRRGAPVTTPTVAGLSLGRDF